MGAVRFPRQMCKFSTLLSASMCVAIAMLSGCVANSGSTVATPSLAPAVPTPADEGSGGDAAASDVAAAEQQSADMKADQAGASANRIIPGVKVDPASRIAPQEIAVAAPRPGSAVYRCGGGRSMIIDNRRSAVTIVDPDGDAMMLPAAPPGQMSRYGQKPYALVLDGNEALYVKPRKTPFTCKR